MKIISLTSENIKRLKAVEIRPDGKSIVVAGRNAQGKSSVLDSILYALGGKGAVCDRPIRDGETKAQAVVDLGEFTVTRTFTASGGSSLTIMPKGGGSAMAKPQSVLDKLIGDLTFDPLKFSTMPEVEQSACLRKLVGLDFTVLEQNRQRIYDQRTQVNREISALAGKLSGRTVTAEVPEAELSIADLLRAKGEVEARNNGNQKLRQSLEDARRSVLQADVEVAKLVSDIQKIEEQLKVARSKQAALKVTLQRGEELYADLNDEPTDHFDTQMLQVEETNRKVRSNKEIRELQAQHSELELRSQGLTTRIERLDKQKDTALADAPFPLPGLAFSSTGGVTYNAIPFSQLSSAEKLRISTAIAMALSPGLRVMLIRDGSLLDSDSLNILKELAAKNDTQLWIERVGSLSNELPGVVIEDGEVTQSTLK
jgi:hypothetical protein